MFCHEYSPFAICHFSALFPIFDRFRIKSCSFKICSASQVRPSILGIFITPSISKTCLIASNSILAKSGRNFWHQVRISDAIFPVDISPRPAIPRVCRHPTSRHFIPAQGQSSLSTTSDFTADFRQAVKFPCNSGISAIPIQFPLRASARTAAYIKKHDRPDPHHAPHRAFIRPGHRSFR